MSIEPGKSRVIRMGPIPAGGANPLVLIAGPCVIESEKHSLEIAEQLKRITSDAGVPFIFKSS